MVYFLKEIVSNRFLIKGAAVPFEVLDGNIGVIALEENDANKPLIDELTKTCGRFGISRISEAEYSEKKTLPQIPLGRSHQRSQRNEKLRVVQTRQPTNPFARQVHQAPAAQNGDAAGVNPPGTTLPQAPVAPPPHSAPAAPATVPTAPAQSETAPGSTSGMLPPKFQPAVRRISRKTESEPAPAE